MTTLKELKSIYRKMDKRKLEQYRKEVAAYNKENTTFYETRDFKGMLNWAYLIAPLKYGFSLSSTLESRLESILKSASED